MFVNLNSLENETHTDFCVIGSGPAGMTVARKLAAAGRKVFLFEGGGEEFSEESQDIYKGAVIPEGSYYPLDVCRLRYLGGTSNHWAGWTRPLESYDFKPKTASLNGGWPIEKADLDIYANEAKQILGIESFSNDSTLDSQFSTDNWRRGSFTIVPEDARRLKKHYFNDLAYRKNLYVFLNSNLIAIDTDGERVTSVTFSTYKKDTRIVHASYFVLATGGIENNRILLYNNVRAQGKLISTSGTLGKYFMEHPHRYKTAIASFFDNTQEKLKLSRTKNNLLPSHRFISKNKLLNHALRFKKLSDKQYKDYKKEVNNFSSIKLRYKIKSFYRINLVSEMEPSANNHISLGSDTDLFGIPRVIFSMRLGDAYFRTRKVGLLLLAHFWISANIGRIKLFPHTLNNSPTPMSWGNHHMGGTRMAKTSKTGVVDKNCRVFGQKNFYIAGSSTFPSGGHANPTYTIVQLALRLADHLLSLRA